MVVLGSSEGRAVPAHGSCRWFETTPGTPSYRALIRGIEMYIDCPECGRNNDLDGDDLPKNSCDDEVFDCHHCDHAFKIGWCAEGELR